MAGTVGDVLDQRRVGSGQLDDPLHDLEVLALLGAAAVVGLPGLSVGERMADPAREVIDIQPVAHVAAVAVNGEGVACEGIEDHQRDQLLGVLTGPVVVGPPTDKRLEPVRVEVAEHEQVGAGLGRAVRTGGL